MLRKLTHPFLSEKSASGCFKRLAHDSSHAAATSAFTIILFKKFSPRGAPKAFGGKLFRGKASAWCVFFFLQELPSLSTGIRRGGPLWKPRVFPPKSFGASLSPRITRGRHTKGKAFGATKVSSALKAPDPFGAKGPPSGQKNTKVPAALKNTTDFVFL